MNIYDIGFNVRLQFSLPDGSQGKNVIIFRVDNSSSVHVDNKKKNTLVFSEGSTQGLDDATLTTEDEYSISSTESRKIFEPILHIMLAAVSCLLMVQKYINSKQKIKK